MRSNTRSVSRCCSRSEFSKSRIRSCRSSTPRLSIPTSIVELLLDPYLKYRKLFRTHSFFGLCAEDFWKLPYDFVSNCCHQALYSWIRKLTSIRSTLVIEWVSWRPKGATECPHPAATSDHAPWR